MPPAIPEILSDRSSGKRSIITHRRRIRRTCRQHDRIFQRSPGAQHIHQSSHRSRFLSDSHIDAINRLTVPVIIQLIQNRIDGNRRLSGLAVTDNQLPLPASDRHHRVDRLDPRLQRLFHRLAINHPRRFSFQRQRHQIALNRACPVDRFTQRIDNTPQQSFAHIDRSNVPRPLCGEILPHPVGRVQQHHSHMIFFQVHRHSPHAVLKLDQLAGSHIIQSENIRHSVAHFQHRTDFLQLSLHINIFQLLLKYIRYFTCFNHNFYLLIRVSNQAILKIRLPFYPLFQLHLKFP